MKKFVLRYTWGAGELTFGQPASGYVSKDFTIKTDINEAYVFEEEYIALQLAKYWNTMSSGRYTLCAVTESIQTKKIIKLVY